MPTGNYWPNSVTGIFYNEWTLSAGSSKWNALLSNDGVTSYIRETTLNQRQNVTINWPTSPAPASVNSMVVYARVRLAAAAGWTAGFGIRNSSGRNSGTSGGLSESWSLKSHTVTARPGGGNWGASDFTSAAATQWEVYCASTGGGGSLQCTQGYVYLDYNEPGGGFIPFFQVLLPLLGAGIGMEHMPRIAALRRRLSGREELQLRPDEIWPALRDLKAWTRPSFSI